MITPSEFSEYLQASEETYRFLGQALFRELNEAALAELAAQDWPRDTGNETLDRGYAQLRRFFNFASTDVRTELAVEYARVFLAAGVFSRDKMTAVPYESVFTSEEHAVMGASRDEVVRAYAVDGFTVNPELHEPEDHLAFELEFLSHLSGKTRQALEAGELEKVKGLVARQAAFIDEHLLNWIGDLHEVACNYAKTTFYTGLLLVAQGALEQSRAVLAEVGREGWPEGQPERRPVGRD